MLRRANGKPLHCADNITTASQFKKDPPPFGSGALSQIWSQKLACRSGRGLTLRGDDLGKPIAQPGNLLLHVLDEIAAVPKRTAEGLEVGALLVDLALDVRNLVVTG